MRRKNTSRMASRAGSILSSLRRGMTFSVCTTSAITSDKTFTICGATDLLPARIIGISLPKVVSILAL